MFKGAAVLYCFSGCRFSLCTLGFPSQSEMVLNNIGESVLSEASSLGLEVVVFTSKACIIYTRLFSSS